MLGFGLGCAVSEVMLTNGYLNVIPHGRTSLAGVFLAMVEARETYNDLPDDDYGDELLNVIGNDNREICIARTDEWYRVSGERTEAHGFHPLAFAEVRIPVEPSEGEAYLRAPKYSERLRRD